jgi:hypothetical protein
MLYMDSVWGVLVPRRERRIEGRDDQVARRRIDRTLVNDLVWPVEDIGVA